MEWRCFHCNMVFTDKGEARLHFGETPIERPVCLIDPAEHRRQARELEKYRDEDTTLHREIARLQTEHAAALRWAEEKGYERGLRDGSRTSP